MKRLQKYSRSYLNEFPNGSFLQNAQFYLAECFRQTGKKDEALKLYVAVAGTPNNQFTEQSLTQLQPSIS